MNREALLLLSLSVASLSVALRCQETKRHDTKRAQPTAEQVRAAFMECEAAQKEFSKAFAAASRPSNRAPLPPELQRLRDAHQDDVRSFLARFGDAVEVPPEACVLVGRVHEMNRDYRAATEAYERFLAAKISDAEETRDALYRVSMSALNSKEPERTEKWMKALIDAEKDLPRKARRGEAIRTQYYWRTLVDLRRFEELEKYGERLAAEAADTDDTAAEDSPTRTSTMARAGAVQACFIAAVNLRKLDRADALLKTVTSAPKDYPTLQGWATQARLALRVHQGEAEEGAAEVAAYVISVSDKASPASGVENNHRRWLTTINEFLGKPAPPVVVDHWVGAASRPAENPLEAWKDHVVVLDFWQPWCEPCRNAMPHLVKLQREHESLRVLGLCKVEPNGYDVAQKQAVRPIEAKDYPAHVEKFWKDMQLNYPLGIAQTATNDHSYQVQGIPVLVVIDRGGIVRYMSIGAGELGLLELAVEGVLKQ